MKISDFPHPELLTRPEALADRLMNERGGVALIETGYDTSSFLHKISECADIVRGDALRGRGVLWTYDGDRLSGDEPVGTNMQQYHPDFHELTTDGFMSHIGTVEINKAHTIGGEILASCLDLLHNTQESAGAKVSLVNLANRTRGGNVGHVDETSYLTLWHGATHPGLRIASSSGFMEIPGVPVGYCLVWRGKKLAGEESATKHTVWYNGRKPRASLVTF